MLRCRLPMICSTTSRNDTPGSGAYFVRVDKYVLEGRSVFVCMFVDSDVCVFLQFLSMYAMKRFETSFSPTV